MLDDVINGSRKAVWRMPDGSFHAFDSPDAPAGPLAILSGSFNPMHAGHIELADAAEQATQRPVAFELSITNVDKAPISREDAMRRVSSATRPIAITRAATFVEKCEMFAGVCFVVGMDTAVRIVDPRYNRDSEEQLRSNLTAIQSAGCRFLVAGRLIDGSFQTLSISESLRKFSTIFTELPESAFRKDISSTGLRNRC